MTEEILLLKENEKLQHFEFLKKLLTSIVELWKDFGDVSVQFF